MSEFQKLRHRRDRYLAWTLLEIDLVETLECEDAEKLRCPLPLPLPLPRPDPLLLPRPLPLPLLGVFLSADLAADLLE